MISSALWTVGHRMGRADRQGYFERLVDAFAKLRSE
jgi:hypothetical protein